MAATIGALSKEGIDAAESPSLLLSSPADDAVCDAGDDDDDDGI